MIEPQLEIELRQNLQQDKYLCAVHQRPGHRPLVEHLIVAKRAVDPKDLMRKWHRHRIEGDQVARHGPRIAAPNDMPARGRHRAQSRHPCAQEVDIHVLHARIEPERLPPGARIQLVDHCAEIHCLLRHIARVILSCQRHAPLPLELFRRIVLCPCSQ